MPGTPAIEASPADMLRKNPTRPPTSPKGTIKLGLYTIAYLGFWYDGPALTFEKIINKAREYGYDGIELDNKRTLGNPMDIPLKKRDEWRNMLDKKWIRDALRSRNNDFSSPAPEQRECQLLR